MKINTSKKMTYIISASVAAVILIGLIVYFCLSTGKDNPDGEPNPTAGVSSAAEETEITATETEPTPEETEVVAEPVETEPTEPEPTEPEPTEPPHVHSYKAEWTKGVTCSENGYTHYVCSCGHSYNSNFIRATAQHSWGEWVDTGVTYTVSKEQKRTCSVCGTWETRSVKIDDFSQISDEIKISDNSRQTKYTYKMCYIVDTRTWRKPLNISIISPTVLQIEYSDKHNDSVKFTVDIPESPNSVIVSIKEDGTYQIVYSGPGSKA